MIAINGAEELDVLRTERGARHRYHTAAGRTALDPCGAARVLHHALGDTQSLAGACVRVGATTLRSGRIDVT
jgi:hypothetical protein